MNQCVLLDRVSEHFSLLDSNTTAGIQDLVRFIHLQELYRVKVKVEQSHYRPGVALRFPGG